MAKSGMIWCLVFCHSWEAKLIAKQKGKSRNKDLTLFRYQLLWFYLYLVESFDTLLNFTRAKNSKIGVNHVL